jgi:hypothetical protein
MLILEDLYGMTCCGTELCGGDMIEIKREYNMFLHRRLLASNFWFGPVLLRYDTGDLGICFIELLSYARGLFVYILRQA